MRIYHYSSIPLVTGIKSLRAQGKLSKEEIAKVEDKTKRLGLIAPYIDHISFFFDPIPSALLAELFKPKAGQPQHPAWYKGNVLYEHVIDLESLGDRVKWEVVESIKKTKFYDEFVELNDWHEDDPEKLAAWLKAIDQRSKEWGEVGMGLLGLAKQVRINKGVTEKAYREAALRPDFEWNRMKYAANVPHLMAYPESGVVLAERINQLVVGHGARKTVNI